METKKYSRKYIGEKFKTNEGYDLLVIDGGSKKGYVTIQIENWISEVSSSNLKRRTIKNPYHKSVFNIGYIGDGRFSVKNNGKITKEYYLWHGIMQRSYCDKYHKKRPTYTHTIVYEDWHNFQVFAEWCADNYIDGWELDKDLLSESDNKIYSPSTCVFIPSQLNSFLTNKKSGNLSGYTGVKRADSKRERWQARICCIYTSKLLSLGNYDTPEEASQAYQTKRAKYAEIWKERMMGILPQKAINNIK